MAYDLYYLGQLELPSPQLATWLASPITEADHASLPAAIRPDEFDARTPDDVLNDLANEVYAEIVRGEGSLTVRAMVGSDSSFQLGAGTAMGAAFVAAHRLGGRGSLVVFASDPDAYPAHRWVLEPGSPPTITPLRRKDISAEERSDGYRALQNLVRARRPQPRASLLNERAAAVQAEVIRKLESLPVGELLEAWRKVPGGAPGRVAPWVKYAEAFDSRAALIGALGGGATPFGDLAHPSTPALAILVLALARPGEAGALADALLASEAPQPWITTALLAHLATRTETGAQKAFERFGDWGPTFVKAGLLVRDHAHPVALELARRTLDAHLEQAKSGHPLRIAAEIVATASPEGLARVCALRLEHPLMRDPAWVWTAGGDVGKRVLAERFGTHGEALGLPEVAAAQMLEGAAATRAKVDRLLSAPTPPAKMAIAALVDLLAANPQNRSEEWIQLLNHLATVLPDSEASFVEKARALAKKWSKPPRAPKKR